MSTDMHAMPSKGSWEDVSASEPSPASRHCGGMGNLLSDSVRNRHHPGSGSVPRQLRGDPHRHGARHCGCRYRTLDQRHVEAPVRHPLPPTVTTRFLSHVHPLAGGPGGALGIGDAGARRAARRRAGGARGGRPHLAGEAGRPVWGAGGARRLARKQLARRRVRAVVPHRTRGARGGARTRGWGQGRGERREDRGCGGAGSGW